MRQDPDVILIGEIRDLETMRTALQAAETGHLVLASLHASTVVDAVNRVIDIFPPDEQRQARASIAESLQGILCQHLVDVGERRPAGRWCSRSPSPRLASARPSSIPTRRRLLQDIVADGQYYGMRTFEQDAVRLVLSGAITVAEAEKVVTRPADLHVSLRRAGYRE